MSVHQTAPNILRNNILVLIILNEYMLMTIVASFRKQTLNKTLKEKFEDTKEAIKTRQSKKDRQHNGQNKRKGTKDKQLQVSTKHYTKN
jgi:hypothetical protein